MPIVQVSAIQRDSLVVVPDGDDVSVDVSTSTRILIHNLSQDPIRYTFDAAANEADEWEVLPGARPDLIHDHRNRVEVEKGASTTLYIRGTHRLAHTFPATLADNNSPPTIRQRVMVVPT